MPVIDFQPETEELPAIDFKPDTSELQPLRMQLGSNLPSEFSSGLPANVPISENPDWGFTQSIAKDPVAFLKSLPGDAQTILETAAAGTGNLPARAYQALPDTIKPYAKPLLAALTSRKYANASEPVFGAPAGETPLPFHAGVPIIQPRGTVLQPEGNPIEKLLAGFTTPGMVATFPFAASKPVQALFLTQTVPGAIDAAEKLVSSDTPPNERQNAATDLLLNGMFSIGLARGLIKKPQPIGGQNAEGIRSNQGQLAQEGQVVERGQNGSGQNLQQPTPGSPESVVARATGARADEGAAPPVEPVKPVLKPALLIDGKPVTGGASHAEILQNLMKQPDLPIDTLDAAVMALEDDSKHVFVDQNGKVYDRTQAAKALGRTGKLQSEDLAKLETKPPVKPAPPSPTPATTPPTGAAVSRDATLHLDYSPEDLAKYQTLRASMKKMSDAGQIMVGEKPNQTFNPEWQRLNVEIEKVRNKYNGNPPKQLVKQATPSPTPSEKPAAPAKGSIGHARSNENPKSLQDKFNSWLSQNMARERAVFEANAPREQRSEEQFQDFATRRWIQAGRPYPKEAIKPAATAKEGVKEPVLSESERQNLRNTMGLLDDSIATKKANGDIVPQDLIDRRGRIAERLNADNEGSQTLADGDYIYTPSDAFGHPENSIDSEPFLPIKVAVKPESFGSLSRFSQRIQENIDKGNKLLQTSKEGFNKNELRSRIVNLQSSLKVIGRMKKELVKRLLAQGKPVPPEVLADYPDLKPSPSVVKLEGKAGKIVITQKPVRKVETADMSASANEISVTLPDGKVYEGFRSRDKGGDWRLSGLKGGFQVRGKTAAEFRANVQKSFDAGEFEHQQPPPAETPAIEPVAAKVKEPSIPPPELKETPPTIKSPLSAFGKQFYKNTAGEWRQKGRPSEKINASRVAALEQLVGPKITSMGGLAPGDPTEPVGKGFVDYGTTGAGQDIYGVAERVRKARAQAGQVAPVPTGQGVSDVEAVKWGQELERSGADAEKSMREFERTKAISFDSMALARGHGETLARAARIIESRGTDTPEYRAAQKTLSDWDTRSKAMQTEWHKIGMAQQGETDIDTGSFTGINRAYREVTGEDLPATHVKTAKGIVKGVKDADSAVEKAKPVLQTAIEGISEKGRPVKVPADLDSQQKEFQDYKSGKPMTPLQVKTLWTRAKAEYIDKGNTNFGDTVHKLADDLSLDPKDVLNGLSQTKQVKRIADDVWKKQRQARMLKQAAKRWIEHAQETWMQKALPTAAKTMFSMKVGLHGTVALGTHAPLVAAAHPIIFKNNFGKMYKLVASPEFYQMQIAEMARRPNYVVAQRNGLVNDMSKMEDFNDPQLAQGFPKMAAWFKDKLDRVHLGRLSGMGTRGYSVLKILRQDLFDHEWNKLPESMKSDSMAKAIADSVNHITGVTKAGAGQLGKVASYALFAPKLEASRVAVLVTDPIRAANSLIKMDNMTDAEKWFAKNQFKQAAKIFAVGTSLMLANQQLNDLFGDGKKLNGVPVALGGGGWNPMQSDFMKFRVAGMNFAWGSPFLTMARLPLRLYQIGAGSGGKTRFLIYPDESMYKTTGSYLRTQASPFLSPIISVITKGDYQDRPLPQIPGYGPPPPVPKRLAAQGVKPYTWTEFISDTMLPIPVEQAVNEVWHDHGLTRTQAQGKSAIKPFITFLVTAGTGGRLTEDWTPKKSPLSE